MSINEFDKMQLGVFIRPESDHGQDVEVEVQARFKLKFGQYFTVDVWLRLRS